MLMAQADIRRLLPHAGRMCLLDELLEWNAEQITCVARTHLASDNPLRREGRLSAVCGIEYAAQVMALHGALHAAQGAPYPRAGYLASTRDLICRRPFLDGGGAELKVTAQCLLAEGKRVIYAFNITDGVQEVIAGRAAVVLDV
jgi:predicted hotdog family 3-hydroxylacyl-ACP dehydratase